MSTATLPKLMTVEEFLEFERTADPNIHRELINGELIEYPEEPILMTTRSARHSEAIARICRALLNWMDDQADLVGTVAGGEARCRLLSETDNLVGLDVAYFQGVRFTERPRDESYFDGPPVIAVEILSPSDTHEAISDKIGLYLANGVKQVWIADPEFHTVTIYRNSASPILFGGDQEIVAMPELPGFHPMVRGLFGNL